MDPKKKITLSKEQLNMYTDLGLIHPTIDEEGRYHMTNEDLKILLIIEALSEAGLEIHDIKDVIDGKVKAEELLEEKPENMPC